MNALVFLLAATLSAGNAEFDRTAAEGAAQITLNRVTGELKTKGPAEGLLMREMLADPGRFVKRDEAQPICREIYRAAVEKTFAAEFAALKKRLSLADEFTYALSEEDRAAAAALFDATFARERQAACEAQAATLVAATRPTEAEFAAQTDEALRRLMTERILAEQKTPVFQENGAYISERMVEPVLQDARREQKRQREYLMRTTSEAFAPSVLTADLKRKLETNVAERKAKSDDPATAWGVFPDALGQPLVQAVERRTLGRLEREVENVPFAVDEEEVAQILADDPPAHIKAAESEKIFRERYAYDILSAAQEKAIAAAPAGERAEFGAFIEDHRAEASVEKSVNARLKKDLMPAWRAVRARVAEKVAAEVWPSLMDGTWYPNAELADTIVARSDYTKEMKRWRRLEGLEELVAATGGKPLPEEADARADRAVGAAFDLARDAIAAQNAIIDRNHQAVLDESRRRKDSFWTRTPDLKKITELLTAAVETRWDEERLETLWPEGGEPANAAEQHRELFPSVKKRIELIAKEILEEMNQDSPPVEQQPEEPPPEEPPPEETPPEETPEEPPEETAFMIEVRRSGDQLEVSLKSGEKVVESSTVPPKKREFKDAMDRVTRALSDDILKLPATK